MITLEEKKYDPETATIGEIAGRHGTTPAEMIVVALIGSMGVCFVAGLIARALYLCAWAGWSVLGVLP